MNDRKLTMRDAIAEALEEELARDPNIVIIGEDIIGDRRRPTTCNLKEKFPNRIINHLPLVEEMICGIGLGMYLGKLKPIIQFDHSTLSTLAFYEIFKLGTWRYRMAEESGPGVVIRMGHSGYSTGGPEYTTALFSPFFSLPNIWIAAPAFAYEAKGLMKTAIRTNRPVLFIEYKNAEMYERIGSLPGGDYTVPFPKATICNPGRDLTIITWQFTTLLAISALEELKKKKISAEVISLQTLYPLDIEIISSSARKTGRVLLVEEGSRRGGISAHISAELTESISGLKIKRVAAKNVPIPYTQEHLKLVLPGKADIIKACLDLMYTF